MICADAKNPGRKCSESDYLLNLELETVGLKLTLSRPARYQKVPHKFILLQKAINIESIWHNFFTFPIPMWQAAPKYFDPKTT